MKNSIFKLSLFLFVVTGFYSCEVESLDEGLEPIEEPTEVETPQNNGTMSVIIDGTTYTTNNITAKKITNYPVSGVRYDVQGVFSVNGNLMGVGFALNGEHSQYIVTNNMFDNPNYAMLIYVPNVLAITDVYSSNNMQFDQNFGQVTITSNNSSTNTFSGNFNSTVFKMNMQTGQVVDTKEVTNGSFQGVKYTIEEFDPNED